MNGSTLISKEFSNGIVTSSPPVAFFSSMFPSGRRVRRLDGESSVSPVSGLNDSNPSSASSENLGADYSRDAAWPLIFDSFANKKWLESESVGQNMGSLSPSDAFNSLPIAIAPYAAAAAYNNVPFPVNLNNCSLPPKPAFFPTSQFNSCLQPIVPNWQAAAVNYYMMAQRQNMQQALRRNQKPSPSVLDSFLSESHLLQDFRAGRLPNLQLRDLVNHVIEFSEDQHGSRFIQQRLQYASDIEKQMVFNEILPSAHLLTINVFGNYVIQKFFELGTNAQKLQLLEQMKTKILDLTLNMYGCRVVQKALELCDREGQRMIANELTGHILRCVRDQNGNHVVQKVIETLDANQLAFVVQALAGQVVALSTHSYGCRVIQRILERCSEAEKSQIVNELIENFSVLVIDQYGNYVVQHILQHGDEATRTRVIEAVRRDMLRLAQHKFASNVVEKCIEFSTVEERQVLISDILNKSSANSVVADCPLLLMMKDQYANYVVQKIIELAEPAQRREVLQQIRFHLPTLKRYTFGKHIAVKLEKYTQKSNLVPAPVEYADAFSGDNGNLFF